jgi:hypothetical protein
VVEHMAAQVASGVAGADDPTGIWCEQSCVGSDEAKRPLAGHTGSLGSAMAGGRCRHWCGKEWVGSVDGIRQILGRQVNV